MPKHENVTERLKTMAIETLKPLWRSIKFRCDELPPNAGSMRFSSRFQGILPMSPPPEGFGHVAYLLQTTG